MKDLGATRKMLGMEIKRDKKAGKQWLSQKNYISKLLEKSSMQKVKPVSTPLATHLSLSARQCPSTDDEVAKYPKSRMLMQWYVSCMPWFVRDQISLKQSV